MKTSKRISALLLTVCLVLGMLVPAVSAETTAATETVTYDFDYLNVVYDNLKKKPGNSWNDTTLANIKALYTGSGDLLKASDGSKLTVIDKQYLKWYFKESSGTETKGIAGSYDTGNGYYFCKSALNSWTAFVIDNPGVGTWDVSIIHPVSGSGASKVEVYFLPMTEDVAGALTSATVNATYSCWNNEQENTDPDISKMCIANRTSGNGGGTWTVTDANAKTYICVIKALTKGYSRAYTYLSEINLTPVVENNVASVGGTDYVDAASAIAAIKAASATDEVKITGDLKLTSGLNTAAAITVSNGAVLDLNGNDLTAKSVVIVNGGSVIDSGETAGLVTANLSASGDNGGYLPISTAANTYKLYKVTVTAATEDTGVANTMKLKFQVKFDNNAAYDALAAGNSGVTIGGIFTWSGNENQMHDITYSDGTPLAQKWGQEVAAYSYNKNGSIVLGFSGTNAFEGLTVVPYIQGAGATIKAV